MLAHCQSLAATRKQAPGIDVTFIPTWGRDPHWEKRLAAIGCRTIHAGSADNLAALPGFPGSIVVGMCNSHVMACRGLLRDLGCRLVWVNCMTFLFENEIRAFRQHGPAEAFVFQSDFQRAELEKVLPAFGYDPRRATRSAGPSPSTKSHSGPGRTPRERISTSADWPGLTSTNGARTTGTFWPACPTLAGGRRPWAGRCSLRGSAARRRRGPRPSHRSNSRCRISSPAATPCWD